MRMFYINRLVATAILAVSTLIGNSTVNAQGSRFFVEGFLNGPSSFAQSDLNFGIRAADDFSFSGPSPIRATRVVWRGGYSLNNAPAVDKFTIQFLESGTFNFIEQFNVENNVNRTLINDGAFQVFEYSAAIDIVLAPDTTYFISIFTDTTPSTEGYVWQGFDTFDGNSVATLDGGATFTNSGPNTGLDLSFELYTDEVYNSGAQPTAASRADLSSNMSRAAAPFSVTEPTLVTTVFFSGVYGFDNLPTAPEDDDFTVEILGDNGGLPGSTLASFHVGNHVSRSSTSATLPNFNQMQNYYDVFVYRAIIDFEFLPGQTYYISVNNNTASTSETWFWCSESNEGVHYGLNDSTGGVWAQVSNRQVLSLAARQRPENDNLSFFNGVELESFPVTTTGTNVFATVKFGEQEIDSTGSTVWWYFDAPADGVVTLDTFGSDYDTQLFVFDGITATATEADLNPVIGNDDAPDAPSSNIRASKVTFPVMAGECYEVRVGGWHAFSPAPGIRGDEGNIVLNGTFEPLVEVFPSSFNVFRGVTVNNELSNVQSSDDSYIQFNPGFTLNSSEAPVWLEFVAMIESGFEYQLAVESNANTPGLEYTVAARNYANGGNYEDIGTSTESFQADSTEVFELTLDQIDSNGESEVRVGWRATGFTLLFPWEIRVDAVSWVPGN